MGNGKEEKWIAEVLKANEASRKGSSSSSSNPPANIPKSLRNAPAHLRADIRRRQNREVRIR